MTLPHQRICPACLAGTTFTAPEGDCAACGHRFPCLFTVGCDEPPWDYTTARMAQFRAHDGLRLMSSFGGKTPGQVQLLSHARELYLSGYSGFSFRHLAGFEQLQDFELDFTRVRSLDGIGPLPRLTIFALTECRLIDDIAPLANVPSIRYASLALCSQLRDYAPLALLPALARIAIEARSVASLSFVRECPSLERLSLRVAKLESADFSPLFELPRLRHMSLAVRGFPRRLLPELRQALPNCSILVDSYV